MKHEDIFYYVYGFLYLPAYRREFAADLKKSLPRIMLVDDPKVFWKISRTGRALAELHLNYESQPAPSDVAVDGDCGGSGRGEQYRVTKLRFAAKDDSLKNYP